MFSNCRITFALIALLTTFNSLRAWNDDDVLELGATNKATERLQLWLTISAEKRFLEVSWRNAPAHPEDHIMITRHEPSSFYKVKFVRNTPLASFDNNQNAAGSSIPYDGFTTPKPTTNPYVEGSGDGYEQEGLHTKRPPARNEQEYWISNGGVETIVAAINPGASSQWFTTGVPFDYELSKSITINTACYGYWASYINGTGAILASSCLRAHPKWMNEMRSVVGGMRMRDIFLPGTHNSGSYRLNFDPLYRETVVTKYSLCQDDDIRGQLMHGARYLDIRVGYYKQKPELFYINHGITIQRPLSEIIDQVKEFVLETNEIVIFGLKEFPVGFGKNNANLAVHRLLVQYLVEQFGQLIVHPSVTWSGSLRDIWQRQQNVILAYDKPEIVREFPHALFGSVEQRWGNVQSWSKLEQFLRLINDIDKSRLGSRPVADMAEYTPKTLDVILDKFGGLRKMADNVNWRLSQLYRDELGQTANIVAVDFIRGTSLMEIAIEWNKRKIIH